MFFLGQHVATVVEIDHIVPLMEESIALRNSLLITQCLEGWRSIFSLDYTDYSAEIVLVRIRFVFSLRLPLSLNNPGEIPIDWPCRLFSRLLPPSLHASWERP